MIFREFLFSLAIESKDLTRSFDSIARFFCLAHFYGLALASFNLKLMKFLYFYLILFLFTPSIILQEASLTTNQTGNLRLQLQNIQPQKGSIKVALFNSKETFLDNKAAYLNKSLEVDQKNTVDISFSNLPYGMYTAAIFHDVNNNGKLDKNLLGVPTEPYGFSNNARSKWGPPKYDTAKFQLDQDQLLLQVEVKKWSRQ